MTDGTKLIIETLSRKASLSSVSIARSAASMLRERRSAVPLAHGDHEVVMLCLLLNRSAKDRRTSLIKCGL